MMEPASETRRRLEKLEPALNFASSTGYPSTRDVAARGAEMANPGVLTLPCRLLVRVKALSESKWLPATETDQETQLVGDTHPSSEPEADSSLVSRGTA